MLHAAGRITIKVVRTEPISPTAWSKALLELSDDSVELLCQESLTRAATSQRGADQMRDERRSRARQGCREGRVQGAAGSSAGRLQHLQLSQNRLEKLPVRERASTMGSTGW